MLTTAGKNLGTKAMLLLVAVLALLLTGACSEKPIEKPIETAEQLRDKELATFKFIVLEELRTKYVDKYLLALAPEPTRFDSVLFYQETHNGSCLNYSATLKEASDFQLVISQEYPAGREQIVWVVSRDLKDIVNCLPSQYNGRWCKDSDGKKKENKYTGRVVSAEEGMALLRTMEQKRAEQKAAEDQERQERLKKNKI